MGRSVERKAIRRIALLGLAAATFSTPAAVGRASDADPGFDCRLVAFSPGFETDETMFCAGLDIDVVRRSIQTSFFVTTDAGRTWTRPPAQGLVTSTASRPEQLIVSPLFDTDRAVYLHTDEGIWKTTDLGETFVLVDSLANPGEGRLAPMVETAGNDRTVFAYANAELTAKIDPPLHVPLAGAPEPELRFVIPPAFDEDGSAFVVARRPGEAPAAILFSCDATLTCIDALFEFPAGDEFGNLWLGPLTDQGQSIFVETLRSTGPADPHPVLWHSVDGGQSFVEWTTANRLLDPIVHAGGRLARVGLAHDPADASRAFLRVSYVPRTTKKASRTNPPGEQVFRTDDGGATWRRVAYGLSFKQSGRAGTVPWTHVNQQSAAHITFAGEGRLVALGNVFGPDGYNGPFCSTDLGRHWSRSCP